MNNRAIAIIVAAGAATRYGSDKTAETIGGRPAVVWSVDAFGSCPGIDGIVVVTHAERVDAVASLFDKKTNVSVVAGGERRQDSVASGLAEVGDSGFVLVHDAARPLVSREVIERTLAALRDGADAAITAIPVVDTIKRRTGEAIETVDRSALFRAQTPQGFRTQMLDTHLKRAERDELTVTDESALFERYGGKVTLVPGDERNLKLTVPQDRQILEAIVSGGNRPETRTGIGYDVHRLVEGRPLVLGGVTIPSPRGLDGHSDADVIVHAVSDALLGAAALGDIGLHFPPGDEQFRNISSLILLQQVRNLLAVRGWTIVHTDAMVVAEAPRIGPYVLAMREAMSGAMSVPIDAVSIKATTNEGMGFVGRQEGISVMATATIRLAN